MADGDKDHTEGEEPWTGLPEDEFSDIADEAGRLDLDEDERLPWLESDDDDGEYAGVDNSRILGFVLLGVIALAALVGGVWWATHRSSDAKFVADGSTVAAPQQPYKEAPKVPGGKTFDGTGDTSFAVSDGQSRPAKLGEQGAAPKPGSDLAGKGRTTPPAATATAAAAPSSRVGVQVGAFFSQATAEAGWARLAQQHSALSGLPHRIVVGQADIGTVYRLQAMASDTAAANALCGKLRSAGLNCQVKN